MSETPTQPPVEQAAEPQAQPALPEATPQEPASEPEQYVDSDIQSSIDEVQGHFDEAEDKGHFGQRVDPTPLENYSVAGVIAGKPTPETDAQASLAAAQATNTAPNVTAQPAASAESPSEAAQADVPPPAQV